MSFLTGKLYDKYREEKDSCSKIELKTNNERFVCEKINECIIESPYLNQEDKDKKVGDIMQNYVNLSEENRANFRSILKKEGTTTEDKIKEITELLKTSSQGGKKAKKSKKAKKTSKKRNGKKKTMKKAW